MIIKRGGLNHVEQMLRLKESLAFESSAAGGFLLGTDREGYVSRVQSGKVWVLLNEERVVGFSIILPDQEFRRSDLWERRENVKWSEDWRHWQHQQLAYYDQLAVHRHTSRKWAAALALVPLAEQLLHGCEALITATVSQPVCNMAAVPYIVRLGGRRVGAIDEHYPAFGALVSDIWRIQQAGFLQRWEHPQGLAERWIVDCATEALRVNTP